MKSAEETEAMFRDFSGELALARESTGKSMREVAEAAGVSRAGIARLEAGERVATLRSLVGLSVALPVRFEVENGVARVVILVAQP